MKGFLAQMFNNNNSIFRFDYPDLEWTIPCQFQYEFVFGAIQQTIIELGFQPLKANVFGSPATIWSGGRKPTIYGELSNKELEKRFEYITSMGGIPTFTFTCTVVEKEHLEDKYANRLAEIASNYGARFIIYSDMLKEHLDKKFPNAQKVASVVKAICHFQGSTRIEEPLPELETAFYNKLLKEYDVVVVRPEYSKSVLTKDTTLLDDLSRIEVMINQMCVSSCPNAPAHSRMLEKERVRPKRTSEFICPKHKLPLHLQYQKNSSHTTEDVEILLKAGIRNLKLQGRGEPVPNYSTVLSLGSQIFRFDGPNNIFVKELLREKLNIEIEHFSKMLKEVRS